MLIETIRLENRVPCLSNNDNSTLPHSTEPETSSGACVACAEIIQCRVNLTGLVIICSYIPYGLDCEFCSLAQHLAILHNLPQTSQSDLLIL